MPVDEETGKYTMSPGHGKAMKNAHKADKRKLESIDIGIVENGYTARCHYKERPGKKGEVSVYEPAKEHIFTSKDTLLKFVTDQLS
ncbi:MAG: hypothetical protein V3S55_08350 [Nitrospiraceae bacterium]